MAEDTDRTAPTAKRPLFFDVYSSKLSSERLKIPVKFIRHLDGITSGLVSLKGPSGNTWQINLIQQNIDLFFHDGWPAFVRDHHIVCGDLLIFRYDGHLHFTVQVFDESSCEKETTFYAECSQDVGNCDKNTGQKRVREESDLSSDIIEDVFRKFKRSSSASSQLNHECDNENHEATVDLSDEQGLQQGATVVKLYQEGNSFEVPKHCASPFIESDILSQSRASVVKSEVDVQNICGREDDLSSFEKGCGLKYSTWEERKVAQSFTSTYPYFVRIMKRFNVCGSYTLKVPYLFSMAHLPDSKAKVVLRNLKGESWTVNSLPTIRVHTSHTLCGGWMAFVRSNAITMGDVCIFELVNRCEFLVHIVGVGKEGPKDENRKAASSGSTIGHDVSQRKLLEGWPENMRGSSKFYSHSTGKVERSSKNGSKARKASLSNDKKKHGVEKAVMKRTRIDDEPKSCMALIPLPDEAAIPVSVASSFPNFVRIMKRFNVSGSYTLKIPYQFSAYLPKDKAEIALRNIKGECWMVNSVPDSKGRMLHTFCGGWTAFVRDNGVKMGDICIFELVGKCEMRVHISGDGKMGIDHQSGKACKQLVTRPSTYCPSRGI